MSSDTKMRKFIFKRNLKGKRSHAEFTLSISLTSLLETLNKGFLWCQALHSFQVEFLFNATKYPQPFTYRKEPGLEPDWEASQYCPRQVYVPTTENKSQIRNTWQVLQLASGDHLILQVGSGPIPSFHIGNSSLCYKIKYKFIFLYKVSDHCSP